MVPLELIVRFLSWVWGYGKQMLPPALLALGMLWLCRPWRQKRLAAKGLRAPKAHETVLAVFVAFCAGLAALTLFPAGFWAWDVHLRYGGNPFDRYYTWEQVTARTAWLDEMLTPFQEIRRAFRVDHSWLWFMLAGNIAMFMPIGAFPGLLWRKWSWWKSLLTGLFASTTIEFVQFFIGRSTDIDDVILNTAGAVLGYMVYWGSARLWPAVGTKCKCQEVKYHG